jgi:two-component system response regulator GlrR
MAHPSSEPPSRDALNAIVGSTDLMREVRRLVALAASRSLDVFVRGEPGTGKELVARAIHALVAGPKTPFLRIEAGAPPGELDSKLFGPKLPHATIYLREIGDLAPALQQHLRQALDERDAAASGEGHGGGRPRFNVRLVSGSTHDLGGTHQKGAFDAALYRRLSTFVIQLPPLRSRREDIPLLVDHFLRLLKRDLGHQVDSFSPAAMGVLMQKNWSGNVRELYEHVRTTVILSPTRVIEPSDLWPRAGEEASVEPWHLGYRELRKRVLLRFETDFVTRMLKTAGGNVSLAARLAKIDRKHLWRLIQRTGIRLDRFDK